MAVQTWDVNVIIGGDEGEGASHYARPITADWNDNGPDSLTQQIRRWLKPHVHDLASVIIERKADDWYIGQLFTSNRQHIIEVKVRI